MIEALLLGFMSGVALTYICSQKKLSADINKNGKICCDFKVYRTTLIEDLSDCTETPSVIIEAERKAQAPNILNDEQNDEQIFKKYLEILLLKKVTSMEEALRTIPKEKLTNKVRLAERWVTNALSIKADLFNLDQLSYHRYGQASDRFLNSRFNSGSWQFELDDQITCDCLISIEKLKEFNERLKKELI